MRWETKAEAKERWQELIHSLFEVMRQDMEIMAEFGDDEDALSEELWNADAATLRDYRDMYLVGDDY